MKKIAIIIPYFGPFPKMFDLYLKSTERNETVDFLIFTDNAKLLVFGSVANELKKDFETKLSGKVIYTGWLNQEEIYDVIGSCDLGFFPGRHSVIWEQIVASGTPCVFKKIEKTGHVDIGGNCLFLEDESYEGIKKTIEYILKDDNYNILKKNALSDKRKDFLYSKIAERSIDI